MQLFMLFRNEMIRNERVARSFKRKRQKISEFSQKTQS